MSNDWASVAIIPNTWKTVAPLAVSGLPGDDEYWYELFMNAPYYAYTDYSGLGLEDKLAELYSENIPVVTNRCDMGILESAGTDWFVRLREGKSPYEELQVVLCIGDETTTNSMEIIKDNTWRGYVQTFTNKTGTARFQIRALNRQVEDSGEFVENVKYWAAGAVQEKMPISTAMPDDGTEDSWTEFTVDAKTGYLMFQVDDNTRSLSVVHADYQNFNLWSDAHKDYFVGNSTANDKKSGSSSTKQSVEQDFETWSNLPTTDNDWVTADFASGTLGHTTYAPFASDVDPNGWEIGKGQWVAKQYRDETKGIALQMAGEGLGKVEFSNTVNMPRCIERVSLAARFAQSMNIDNVCTYCGDNG